MTQKQRQLINDRAQFKSAVDHELDYSRLMFRTQDKCPVGTKQNLETCYLNLLHCLRQILVVQFGLKQKYFQIISGEEVTFYINHKTVDLKAVTALRTTVEHWI